MEFKNFFNLLKKNRLTIIIVPIIAVIITYFLVRNQPDSYSSQAKLATGIVDQTQKVISDETDPQESKINMEFSNLIEMFRSKKVLDQLSYVLMSHDLSSPDPYRKPSALLKQLNNKARLHALQTYSELYKRREPLSLFNADQRGLYKLLQSMGYDDKSLLNNFTIYRIQNSDYITVQFESDKADLSAVAVNVFCNEFLSYYTFLIKDNQRKAVDFWTALLRAKEETLNEKMAALKAYKIKNNVLNLNEKAKSVYDELKDFESRKSDLNKTIQSTQAVVADIDEKFNPKDPMFIESTKVELSQRILSTREQLKTLNDEYVESGFDPSYKKQIDSLSAVLTGEIQKLSDKYVTNPLAAKQNLVDQKLSLQIQNELAKNSTSSVDNEIVRLNKEFKGLVPNEGTIQALESDISVASQEYLEILQKYNQTSMVSKFSIQLRIIEVAQPGVAQPSKKMLLVIISGVISFIFCVVVFFLLFFFDDTIKSPRELANRTKIPVLGHVPFLKSKSIDLRDIWNNAITKGETKQFRNFTQSLRFEVDNELKGHKVLLINSIEQSEGKTFIAINLAYAYSTVNKNVLLIDGNFGNPGITDFAKTNYYLEDFLTGNIDRSFFTNKSKIKVLGNRGNDISLLELNSEQQIQKRIDELKAEFDLIIVEASSLETLNKSKEWVIFSDKILTVFEAGKKISEPIKHQIEYLKATDGQFIGWVLNLEESLVVVDDNK
jgi:uncharacterized protein involved in exopolysaccharide biosynthesis/Mrp family chromosome partitioning ATPase